MGKLDEAEIACDSKGVLVMRESDMLTYTFRQRYVLSVMECSFDGGYDLALMRAYSPEQALDNRFRMKALGELRGIKLDEVRDVYRAVAEYVTQDEDIRVNIEKACNYDLINCLKG